MHTFYLSALLLTFVLLLVVEPTETQAQGGPASSIACDYKGQYIGGIDRHYSLKIDAAPKKTWRYDFRMDPGRASQSSGTYELAEGLAIFTGRTDNKEEFRFGVNYGFPARNVHFSGFFPDATGKQLVYQRRWYRQVEKVWQTSQELRLILPIEISEAKDWRPEITGTFTTWDNAKKVTQEEIRTKLHFQIDIEGVRLQPVPGGKDWSLLSVLRIVRFKDGKVDSVLVGNDGGPSGLLQGFHPSMALPIERPGK